ncbi:uncharacterized protein LOC111626179 [Centruroides sculpturatus]|uniref:uncharacterized protein LOC111626179 n=1 Tax=Centruroides sculpturatus TaxID=218467 RepID=UPI000C6EB1A0|nr:uncharacterized protein LOC111626179 [Centruroides sculpturatus]
MGSPLLGDLCELVIRQLKGKIILRFVSNILIYKRYVDDIFILWKAEPNINNFLSAMNDNPYRLTIKLDQKSNTAAHFLDIHLQLDGTRVVTKVHYKSYYRPLFILANSADPYSYKISAFSALTKRAFTHHTRSEDKEAELKRIQNIAVQHGYRKNLIYDLARAYVSRIAARDTSNIQAAAHETHNVNSTQSRAVVEYNHHLNSVYREIAAHTNTKIAYNRPCTVYGLLRSGKDKINKKQAPGVYMVPLWDNRFQRELVYIGSTKRSLNKRLQEHKYDIVNKRHTTTLSTYATEPCIRAHLHEAKLIKLSHQVEHLRNLESLEIYKAGLRTNCIKANDAVNVSHAWKYCYEVTGDVHSSS